MFHVFWAASDRFPQFLLIRRCRVYIVFSLLRDICAREQISGLIFVIVIYYNDLIFVHIVYNNFS